MNCITANFFLGFALISECALAEPPPTKTMADTKEQKAEGNHSATALEPETGDIDPFGMPVGGDQSGTGAPKEFDTTGGFEVSPATSTAPWKLNESEWPVIEAPLAFNSHFTKPTSVWKLHSGGYFGSFDAGEFGGALFFAKPGSKKWRRVLNAHVGHLFAFDELASSDGSVIAAGGLAHRMFTYGEVYHLSQSPSGQWVSRLVMTSHLGVPAIVGTTHVNHNSEGKDHDLVVIGIAEPNQVKTMFGVTRFGGVHHLGESTQPAE